MPLYTLVSSPTLEEGQGTRRVSFEAASDAAAVSYAQTAPDDLLVSSPVRVAVQAADGYPLWSCGAGRVGMTWAASR